MRDEIIEELWRSKDAVAKRFNFDIRALATELKKSQQQSPHDVVDRTAEATRPSIESRTGERNRE